MADVVNLRQARKRKTRAEKESKAAANRVKFGQSKPVKLETEKTGAKRERDLDGKKLDP